MSALHELLKEIPSDYDEVDVANHLLHFREAAAAELAALTQRLEAAEAERDMLKKNNSRKLFRLQYINNNVTDRIAIRFALDASDREIDEAILQGDA